MDNSAIIQVIGTVYNNPQLLDYQDKYIITDEDFPDKFHRTIFGAIYKMHELGAKEITLQGIADFLASRPNSEAIYKAQKGEEWLIKASESSVPNAFDYYYSRMKKFSLLRAYDNVGIDVSFIYNTSILIDLKERNHQEDLLDNSKLEEIAEKVDQKIQEIKDKYVDNIYNDTKQAGEGIQALISELKEKPSYGVPLYGPLINTVCAGARLGKYYLRSAGQGYGKTRTMIADACYIACDQLYDENFGWIKTGIKEPTLYIAVEQDLKELQTMMLAFLSNVNEEHIVFGRYEEGEEERVRKAGDIIENSPLYVEYLPDFSLNDIESIIMKNIREKNTKYIFWDYLQSSLKILGEISSRTGGMKLREDNILFIMSAHLKDICNTENVFIMTSTQLSGDFVHTDTPDQSLLRGSKAISDRIDVGMIILNVNQDDLKKLQPVLETNVFQTPVLKISVYKNRRGRYKGIYLWCKADLGTCRVQPMFATTWAMELIPIDDIKITIDDLESAF